MEGNMVIVDINFGNEPDEHGFIFKFGPAMFNRISIHRKEGDPKYGQINVTYFTISPEA